MGRYCLRAMVITIFVILKVDEYSLILGELLSVTVFVMNGTKHRRAEEERRRRKTMPLSVLKEGRAQIISLEKRSTRLQVLTR